MRIKFWGVTGSLPAPSCREAGFDRSEFGGNTSCVEARLEGWPDGRTVVFDVGSGARGLGADMMRREKPLEAHILISHTHWDHVQGLPFFAPLYVPGSKLHFYGLRKTKGMSSSLAEVLAGQQQYPTFPRQLDQCPSFRAFRDLDPFGDPLDVCGAKVEHFELNHPDGCMGYVLTESSTGKRFAYCTDTEHFSNTPNPNIARHCKDAVLYIDGQYTEEEYVGAGGKPPKVTWGHNTIWAAVREAKACGAARLIIGHHDHFHDDTMLRRMEAATRGIAKEMGYDPDRVWFAREGAEIQV